MGERYEVYEFRSVLRGLRLAAGLTILAVVYAGLDPLISATPRQLSTCTPMSFKAPTPTPPIDSQRPSRPPNQQALGTAETYTGLPEDQLHAKLL